MSTKNISMQFHLFIILKSVSFLSDYGRLFIGFSAFFQKLYFVAVCLLFNTSRKAKYNPTVTQSGTISSEVALVL